MLSHVRLYMYMYMYGRIHHSVMSKMCFQLSKLLPTYISETVRVIDVTIPNMN